MDIKPGDYVRIRTKSSYDDYYSLSTEPRLVEGVYSESRIRNELHPELGYDTFNYLALQVMSRDSNYFIDRSLGVLFGYVVFYVEPEDERIELIQIIKKT